MEKRLLLTLFLSFYISQLFAFPTTQYQEPKILGSQQGLSSAKVNSIIQDEKKFIWIATEDGLNKFDGYRFIVYRKIENDTTSLLNNNISALCYDSEKRLWVGSMSGLMYYDNRKDSFVKANLGQSEDLMMKNAYNWIMEDSEKNIWFSVHDLGVFRYSLKTQQSVLYKSISDGGDLCSKSIRHISEDKDGNIWFSSFDNGITVYNPRDNSFSQLNTDNSNLSTNSILRISPLHNGNMLVTTLGSGIYIFDKALGKFYKTNSNVTAFAAEQIRDHSVLIGTEGEGLLYMNASGGNIYSHPAIPKQRDEIISSKIHCLLEDDNGDLWIGMYNSGVCYLRKEPYGFTSYRKNYDNVNSLSYGQITGITTNEANNIWFATDGGGLNYYNRTTNKYTYYKNKKGDRNSLPDDAVVSVFCDSKRNIWAGTYLGGLCRFDKSTGGFITYQHADNENSLPGNFVKCIVEDQYNNLWLGTDGNGISYFNTTSGTFKNYSASEYDGFISDNVTSLYLQDNKTLWIGGYTGIFKMDVESRIFKSYEDEISVSNLTIYSITEDNHKNLWVGTSSGLYKYSPDNDAFQKYYLPDRFRDIVINGIVPYKDQLWLSTNSGIVCYIPDKKHISAVINNNDLGGTNFIRSSYYKSPDNEIFFGGGNGCYAFYPEKIELEEYSPKVYITNFEIFNEAVAVGRQYNGRVILNESLAYTDYITLKHSENTFTFRFSSPTTLYPSSISYLCHLEGADNQWVYFPPTQQSVTYANLSPGIYTFQVYASNIPDPTAKDVTTLTIEILPPVWLTWWAKTGYVIGALLLLALIFWVIYIRIRDKSELKMERLRAKEQEELNQSKMQFFTNISHEFRTPLTLIISPLKEMEQSETNQNHVRLIQIMLRNANRLLRLINQILDLRKAENNKIKIEAHPIDLVLFSRDFIGLFSDIVHKRNISLSISNNSDDIEIWYDPDLLEKCLYNLLFNALKYTPDKGKIELIIEKQSDNNVLLSICDNGSGIKQEELPYLFDRFYQGEYSRNSGTGIGLHLVRTIIELHHGNIHVESEEGAGSCFTIFILGGKAHLNPEDCNNTQWLPAVADSKLTDDKAEIEDVVHKDSPDEQDDAGKPLILLVEDEDDMRAYIHYRLSDSYRIIEANNGKDALEKLKALQPELIITDIMMPEMDGIEFTRIVKENMETCHIPVILLTANGETEQKLEGMDTGADSYIVKPFNSDYLHIRIKKLLETRKKMREKFSRLLNLEAKEVEVTNPDELLLQNCISFIRSNISEPDLSVEEIAKKLNVSRTNLHRKIKTLTGSSPVELVKTIRMKQAAYLLGKGSMTISEVAYEVGYNSLSYFSSSFSSYWGATPSEYIKTNH